MAALGFWDAFNQGLEVGNKIHAASAQRNMDQELAGVMDPEQQAAVYSKYGQADKANQMKTLAQQNKLMGLQVDAAMREADKAKRLGALDEEYQTLSSGLLKGTEAVKAAMDAGQMTPEQGAAALQQFYNHHIPNGYDLHIVNGQLVHDDPHNPGKKVAIPASADNILAAFGDLPVMLQGEFERRKNALIGDYGATRRAAQENAKFGLELRGANRADRALDFQISDADRNYNQRGAFHNDDVNLRREGMKQTRDIAEMQERGQNNRHGQSLRQNANQFTETMNLRRFNEFYPDVGKPNAPESTGPTKVGNEVMQRSNGVTSRLNPDTNTWEPIGVGKAPQVSDTALAYGVRPAYYPDIGWAYTAPGGRMFSNEQEALAAARPPASGISGVKAPWRAENAVRTGLTGMSIVPGVGPIVGTLNQYSDTADIINRR